MSHTITVTRKVVTEVVEKKEVPLWMRHALNGERSAAIKTLCAIASYQDNITCLDLKGADNIVRDFMTAMGIPHNKPKSDF